MPEISLPEATRKLTEAIRQMRDPDMIEVYGELFPEEPTPRGDLTAPKEKIFDHMRNGLEIDEILSLWSVTFPDDRRVQYDEIDDKIHWHEASEYDYVPWE